MTYEQQLLEKYLRSLGMDVCLRAYTVGILGTGEALVEMLKYIVENPDADQALLFSTACEISERLDSAPKE